MNAIILALISAIGHFGLKLILSVSTEKYIAKGMFYAADLLAAKTTNGIDDKAIAALQAAYYAQNPNEK